MTTRICLIRHGETVWNSERRLQGHTDVPLSSTGLAQAHATARHLEGTRFDAIYSSDLRRAQQTAEPCAERLGMRVVTHAGLRERHFGVFQGLTYPEAAARFPEAYRHFEARKPDYAFAEGGESLLTFSRRTQAVLMALATRHRARQILIFTHGGVLDCVNRMIRNLPLQSQRDFLIPNAALNWISFENERWQINSWARVDHLKTSADELPDA